MGKKSLKKNGYEFLDTVVSIAKLIFIILAAQFIYNLF